MFISLFKSTMSYTCFNFENSRSQATCVMDKVKHFLYAVCSKMHAITACYTYIIELI